MSRNNESLEKKKIGWLCSYVPEELIIAAGFDPVRVQGRVENIKQADSFLFPNLCPYLKNFFESGLQNRLEGLEGIIFTNSCDGMRRLYDIWVHYVRTPFSYMLEIPKNRDEHAIQYFSEQLFRLKARLEEVFAVNIPDDKLKEAITLMNRHRSMMISFSERQKAIEPCYKGSELLTLALEEMTSPKDETTEKLKRFVDRLENPDSSRGKCPRLLVMGNVVDKLNLFKMVEDVGASVVVFDTCTGLRHYSDLVEEGGHPIQSLARRYLMKPPCARLPAVDQRMDRLGQLLRDYSVDGVIYSTLKFCDYAMFEATAIERSLRNLRVPFLLIENDYIWGDEGRITTRIEAFLEMIKGDLN